MELIQGEFYTDDTSGDNWTIKYDCRNKYLARVCNSNNNNSNYNNANTHGKNESNFRLSTPNEKSWLEACIKANKFIPFEKINQNINYEIY